MKLPDKDIVQRMVKLGYPPRISIIAVRFLSTARSYFKTHLPLDPTDSITIAKERERLANNGIELTPSEMRQVVELINSMS